MNSNTSDINLYPHLYERKYIIHQAKGVVYIKDNMIPLGYVNVSEMCLAGKKQLKNYLSNKETLSYLQALAEAETQQQEGSRILLPDNHSTCNNSKEYGLKSGLLIETENTIGGSGAVYAIALSNQTAIVQKIQ